MKAKQQSTIGLSILLGYLVIVIGIEILRGFTSLPIVAWLASSPFELAHGQWWRLITSAFLIEGSPVPQVLITGVLGALVIWFRGSWFFWAIAGIGHIVGTLVTYITVILGGLLASVRVHHFLSAPDYGISLIWCAALGAVGMAAWLGPSKTWNRAYRPLLAAGCLILMVIIAVFSPGFDELQHTIAFAVGAVLVAVFDRTAQVSRHPAIRRAA